MTLARVRVYLPLDAASMAELGGPRGAVRVSSGYAVTPALAHANPGADDEELEYAAFTAAAAAAAPPATGAAVAAASSTGRPARRVVGSADLAPAELSDPGDAEHPARVDVSTEVPLARFASFHVDDERGEASELSWYDVTELAAVVELLEDP